MSGVFKQPETSFIQDRDSLHSTEVTEISAESLSLDLDSLGASSTSVLFSSNNERIFSAVRQKLRYLASSMLPVGPDGPDEKPLSPRNANPKVTVSPSPPPKSIEGPPRPPFSCVPVYIFIMATLCLIILMGGINAVLELRPEFIYGTNSTEEIDYFNHTFVL